MKAGVWEAVMERDRQCVLAKLDPIHICRTVYGTEHAPDRIDLLTIEHVKGELMMGKRAPDDLRWCLALCGFANNRPPSKVQRAMFRDYLAGVA